MVAPNSNAAPRRLGVPGRRRRARSGLKRLVLAVTRLISIQMHLVMLQAKLTVRKILLAAIAFAAAAVVGVLAIVFLYIGVFDVLCLAMRPMYALLTLGGVHLIIAMLLIVTGKAMLGGRDEPAPMNPPEHQPDDPAYARREQESAP